MAVKDSQVAEELVQMVQAALVTAQGPRGNTAACRAACARLAREEREAAGRGRAQIDSSALAELLQKAEVSASGRGAKLALKTGAWEAHICKAEAGDGCAMQREPCQTFHGMELAFQHEQRQVQWRQARSPQRLPMEMAGPGRPGRAAVASTLWDLPGVAEEFQGRYAPPGQAEELFDFAQRRERERRQPPEMRVEAGAEGERGGRGKGGKARGRNEEEGGGGGGAAGEVPEEAAMDMEAQYEEIRAQEGEEEQGGGSGTNTPRKQPRQGMAQSPGGGAGAPRETRGRAAGQAAEAARPMLMEDVARTEAERASAAQVIGLGGGLGRMRVGVGVGQAGAREEGEEGRGPDEPAVPRAGGAAARAGGEGARPGADPDDASVHQGGDGAEGGDRLGRDGVSGRDSDRRGPRRGRRRSDAGAGGERPAGERVPRRDGGGDEVRAGDAAAGGPDLVRRVVRLRVRGATRAHGTGSCGRSEGVRGPARGEGRAGPHGAGGHRHGGARRRRQDPCGAQRGEAALGEPRAGPVDKSDGEAEARGRFLRLIEEGIEPHPGPGQQGGGKQRKTVYTRDMLDRIGCTFNHRSCHTVTDSERKGGGTGEGTCVECAR